MKSIKLRVLIIDDDENYVDLYKEAFNNIGFTTEIVGSCDALNKRYPHYNPDIYIIDIFGMETEKFKILKSIVKQKTNRPIIAISSLTSFEDRVKSYEIGAHGFVYKSHQLESLLDVVLNQCSSTLN